MDTKEDQPQQQPNDPVLLMGGMAYTIDEVLDAKNRPDVMAKMDAWLARKENAFLRAETRKRRTRPRRS